jgi:interleukin-1 receptor-associated kinase 1
MADAAAAELLAEEAAEKPSNKSKSRKAKGRAKAVHEASPAQPQQGAETSDDALGGGASAAVDVADVMRTAAADNALCAAMADGTCDGLSAALEIHHAAASDAVTAEARAMRDTLKARRKKHSQKERKAHAGAMQALATLQTARCTADADALQAALTSAAGHEGDLLALQQEVSVAQGMLAAVSMAADPDAPRVIELSVDDLNVATDHFADKRIVGMGGFGKVYAAEAIASLQVAGGGRLAVKRANDGLDLTDVRMEMAILLACEHPHLLPLYGYCLDGVAPCLVFPLMVGGATSRVDPESS